MCFYKKGLYFKCLKCSRCCTGFPGYVWITQKEIQNIYEFLKMTKKDFLNKYTRQIAGLISLKETLPNYDCCFLKNKKCTIYIVRPLQCKNFPFWKNNLKNLKSWQSLKEYCPGIDNQEGKFFSFDNVQKKLNS